MPRTGPSNLKQLKNQSLLTRRQENNTRERMIKKTSAIVRKVEDCALGNLEMTQTQLNACKLWMDKTLGNAPPAQPIDTDELSDLSREELENRLKSLVEQNPMLALMAGFDTAINQLKTVKTIEPDDTPEST